MCEPLLSVIVPSFNTRVYLQELIRGIQRQTYRSWELIVVDDHSNDGTEDMVASFVLQDSRIRYFKRNLEPKGAQTCRNIGFELSSGKYIMFFDSDDLVAEFCFQQRVQAMEKSPHVDVGIFPATSFFKKIGDSHSNFYGIRTRIDIFALFIARVLPFVVWNNIYRKESLLLYKIRWDETLTALQDSDFNINTILNDLTFEFFDGAEIDYYWRSNPKGISSSLRMGKKNEAQVYFFNKLCSSLTSLSLVEKYEKEIVIQLLEMLKIFSASFDRKSSEEVLRIAKRVIGKRLYSKILIVYKLYVAISPKIPFEVIFLTNIHKHKMYFLADREEIKNETARKLGNFQGR